MTSREPYASMLKHQRLSISPRDANADEVTLMTSGDHEVQRPEQRLRTCFLPGNVFSPGRLRQSESALLPSAYNKKKLSPRSFQGQGCVNATTAAYGSAGCNKSCVGDDAQQRWDVHNKFLRDSALPRKANRPLYTSSSRVGNHVNRPSARISATRPSSAVTIPRPLSPGYHMQRALSAYPSGRLPLGLGTGDRVAHQELHDGMPPSGLARLGAPQRSKGRVDAAARRSSEKDPPGLRGSGGFVLSDDSDESTPPSRGSVANDEDISEDIYEDLEEDDGELDRKISIMESRFSSNGRERSPPASDIGAALGDSSKSLRDLPRPVARSAGPARASPTPSEATGMSWLSSRPVVGSPQETEPESRSHHSLKPGVLRIVRRRPVSAPTDALFARRQAELKASLRARLRRVETSLAGVWTQGEPLWTSGVRGDGGCDLNEQGGRGTAPSARDVKTAVLSWDCHLEGFHRPLSCATLPDFGEKVEREWRRPSSAAFRRWIEARPSARCFVSAGSSARTLGMEDPELAHIQLEMESRRGHLSLAALSRVEHHYTALLSRNTPQETAAGKGMKGRPFRPSRDESSSGGGAPPQGQRSERCSLSGRSPEGRSASAKRPAPGGARTVSRRETEKSDQRREDQSSPKSRRTKGPAREGRGQGGGGGGGAGERGEGGSQGPKATKRSRGASRRGIDGGDPAAERSISPMMLRKMYPSAGAFMASHFPHGDARELSLLGLEQLEECRRASEALARIGLPISGETLRRALVIPTDRPLETCLAGLPRPLEGFRVEGYHRGRTSASTPALLPLSRSCSGTTAPTSLRRSRGRRPQSSHRRQRKSNSPAKGTATTAPSARSAARRRSPGSTDWGRRQTTRLKKNRSTTAPT